MQRPALGEYFLKEDSMNSNEKMFQGTTMQPSPNATHPRLAVMMKLSERVDFFSPH